MAAVSAALGLPSFTPLALAACNAAFVRDYFGVYPEWLVPDDWCKVPFTHTITQTTCYGIPHFNPGVSLYLVEDRAPMRDEMFIWCQKSFDGFPTAPV
jgi:hypothetical protein